MGRDLENVVLNVNEVVLSLLFEEEGLEKMSQKLNRGKAEWEKYENNPEPIHWAASLGDHLAVRYFCFTIHMY